MKVSCVMCTYGRFKFVEKSISMFFLQDYADKELIIFNTAPKALESDLPVTIINNEIDYKTGNKYDNLGAIRRDALTYAKGDIYVCWDDDDLYASFHLSRGLNRLRASGKSGWKPKYSLYTDNEGRTYEWVENAMEASIIVKRDRVFFDKGVGDEHIGWLNKLLSEGDLQIEDVSPLSYCYFWGGSRHKISGDTTLSAFDNHKRSEVDFGDKKLELVEVSELIEVFNSPIAYHNAKKAELIEV